MDPRYHATAPLYAHSRGRAGAGDHPISSSSLLMALGGRPGMPTRGKIPSQKEMEKTVKKQIRSLEK